MLLAIKVERSDYTHYSKPFFLNNDTDKFFIAQIIRDVDFSFIIENSEQFILTILLYHEKNDYYKLNSNINLAKEPKILGIYQLFFKNNNHNYLQTHFNDVLDNEYNLKITFNMRYRKIENDYILSTPTLYGNKKFIEKFI